VTELDEAALHADLDVRPWNDPDPEVSLRPGGTARRWALLSQRESDPRLRGRRPGYSAHQDVVLWDL